MNAPNRNEAAAVVIEGGAKGADRIAGWWAAKARQRGVGWVRFPADWRRLGNRAGPARNQEMVDWLLSAEWEPFCLAFPTASSVGTWDMVARCKVAGIKGLVVRG